MKKIIVRMTLETNDVPIVEILQFNEDGTPIDFHMKRSFYEIADALSAFALCSKFMDILKEEDKS